MLRAPADDRKVSRPAFPRHAPAQVKRDGHGTDKQFVHGELW